MKKQRLILLILFSIAGVFLLINFNQGVYIKNQGYIHGTFYHFTYKHPKGEDIQSELEDVMHNFDNSLSTFVETSTISKINSNTNLSTDALFNTMFTKAQEISEQTNGAFDITVAPIVNLWGFGYEANIDSTISQSVIDSILEFTGYNLVKLKDNTLIKNDPRVKLDASAIAKGLSVDMVAEHIESKGINDYLVEIGGEIRAKGLNPKGEEWTIGIDQPIDDPAAINRTILEVVKMTNKALATSGNYRNFYVKDGVKYSHTIDPRTGYPVKHNLLSATVIAEDCMTADAWATACMVMGVEKSLDLINMNKNMAIYLIYNDTVGEMKTVFSKNFKSYLPKE